MPTCGMGVPSLSILFNGPQLPPYFLNVPEGILKNSQFLWSLIGSEFSNPVNKEAVDATWSSKAATVFSTLSLPHQHTNSNVTSHKVSFKM